MKITRVEAFHVDWGAGRSRSAWVRIWTDDGSFGLGEASGIDLPNEASGFFPSQAWKRRTYREALNSLASIVTT